jgi:large subunit ribosomal protein L13
MKTYQAKESELVRDWYLINAEGQVLGRMASEIARRLRGKHKPVYTPYADTGDFIVVVNADKMVLTGKKLKDKVYYHHSGYPGGLKEKTAGKMMQEKPCDVLWMAVKGMLPKNSLGRRMLKKMKVYAGNDHHHEAQSPKLLQL